MNFGLYLSFSSVLLTIHASLLYYIARLGSALPTRVRLCIETNCTVKIWLMMDTASVLLLLHSYYSSIRTVYSCTVDTVS